MSSNYFYFKFIFIRLKSILCKSEITKNTIEAVLMNYSIYKLTFIENMKI